MATSGTILVHYRRPPDRIHIFEQEIVAQQDNWTLTLLAHARLRRPQEAGGKTILEPDAPILWFTYEGEWHDIGLFHLANGEFTGYYANVITPANMDGGRWDATDLFLDVWCPVEGEAELLDEAEFEEAVKNGWIDEKTARRAREEADRMMTAARKGEWPPEHVKEWTLERAREVLEGK